MKFGINTLDDFQVRSKTVLCRVDINQPVDKATGFLKSTARIAACVPTIRELSDKGAKVVLMAHQGSDIEYANFYTTNPHARILSQFLDREVKWIEDVCGPTARIAIKTMKDGEIILLDNVRFCSEEQTLFEMKLQLSHEQQAKTQVVEKLSPLGDLYVCDAFSAAHRDQPSLCGFEQVLPSAMGRLFEQEYCMVSSLMETPEHPCVFVLGGLKISDAFLMMETVLNSGVADLILTGGLVGQILLVAQGVQIGTGTWEFIEKSDYKKFITIAKEILAKFSNCVILPVDLAQVKDGCRQEKHVGEIPDEFNATDIGSATAELYRDAIMKARTVFANGPVGIFEDPESALGTRILLEAMGVTQGYTIVGGGDSITAVEHFHVADKINYLCTGGGALIRFLTGEILPVVRALRYAATAFPGNKYI